ncbi:MAG: hypothetical protein CO094_12450 [Anaerolineae bacterium CG_4_9_14_3_um_filter_57_17]|nr:lamin tail domain-containing protein [bacterium]NCT20621.1 lamin tail domain-containing protein [bacterium]OIO85666.1 MAG: hypothetical protein AUK01_05455 [Anaerolineae bacterium CG2_30_57_67]PJB64581.1 MAG: hypothetical protein CO094_12450 [Anaerolineae bacterium CG_4_9_14_3_um_filter_57_17]
MKTPLCFLFSLLLALLAACAPIQPGANLSILPKSCQAQTGQQVNLTLNGTLPPNVSVRWEASAGSIVSTPQGLNATFTAPDQPGSATIYVYISSGTPGSEIPLTITCQVTDSTSPPEDSTPTQQPPVTTIPANTVIISEVMGNICGGDEFKKWNQYVELYNYGDQPVDVGGWWLADSLSLQPDEVVAWATRNPDELLPAGLVTVSTVIPPGGVALILSPTYAHGENPYNMPYTIPAGTVILTAAASDRLGDNAEGLQVYNSGSDIVVLYRGGEKIANEILSTYGSPFLTNYPQDWRDNRKDQLPLDLDECSSAERLDPRGGDIFGNWRSVTYGSPGEVPFR